MPSLPPWKTKALPLDMNLSLRYSCTDAWSKEGAPRDSSRRRRLLVKLDVYRKFTNALAVAILVSVGWICYEVM